MFERRRLRLAFDRELQLVRAGEHERTAGRFADIEGAGNLYRSIGAEVPGKAVQARFGRKQVRGRSWSGHSGGCSFLVSCRLERWRTCLPWESDNRA